MKGAKRRPAGLGTKRAAKRKTPHRGAKRAAIYLRVSSLEQTYENQRPDVERIAKARGWPIVARYAEHASASNGQARPAFESMMKDAHGGAFEVVIVWSLDRFGRSLTGNTAAVLELDRMGVQVVSARETWLDTGSPVRSLLVAIFSWQAEQETAFRSERTIAGMVRARAAGAKIGRPRTPIDKEKLRALHAAGDSHRKIAQRLHVPRSTIGDALRDLREAPSAPPSPKRRPKTGVRSAAQKARAK